MYMSMNIKKQSTIAALFCLSALSLVSLLSADCDVQEIGSTKYYRRRSDSRHKYVQMCTVANRAALRSTESDDSDNADWYHLSIAPGYRGSFDAHEISETLFGSDIINTYCDTTKRIIKIQGSAVTKRDPQAWLADYFYLPTNFDSTLSFRPEITTAFADFDFYASLDSLLCGLYFRAYAPIVHTKWNLDMCEMISYDGPTQLDHPFGYFSPAPYEGTKLVQSFKEYAVGGKPQASANVIPWITTAAAPTPAQNSDIKFTSLQFGKMAGCGRTDTGLADLRAELGVNFWQSQCKHLGINLQIAAPTGGTKKANFLFDAMVGNGGHWELGAGLTGHYVFWTREKHNQSMSIHIDANITHLFKREVQRTFDLKGKPNSAYMLVAKFDTNPRIQPPGDQVGSSANQLVDGMGDLLINPNAKATDNQFAFEYQPVANLSTVKVDVSIPIQADISIMLNYQCGPVDWEMGYNFWAQSAEDIDCPTACESSLCDPSQKNTWGLKGDARMFGFDNQNTATNDLTLQRPIPLSATESLSDIHSGTNMVPRNQVADRSVTTPPPFLNNSTTDINRNIDNPEFAYEMYGFTPLVNIPAVLAGAGSQIKTSAQAILLRCTDISFTRLKSTSHTLFSNVSYTWQGTCWSPYISCGKAIEFGTNNDCCKNSKSSKDDNSTYYKPYTNCAISQWSVWIKGGLFF